MRATHRAIGILFQLQLPELELQRVEQDQASDERLARPEDELDRLHRLDRADDAGEDAEHAAFSARGHESRRGRLRVEAAVAWTPPGVEHRGLALESEDRPEIGRAHV